MREVTSQTKIFQKIIPGGERWKGRDDEIERKER